MHPIPTSCCDNLQASEGHQLLLPTGCCNITQASEVCRLLVLAARVAGWGLTVSAAMGTPGKSVLSVASCR